MFNTLLTNFHSNALSSVSDLVKQMGVGSRRQVKAKIQTQMAVFCHQ